MSYRKIVLLTVTSFILLAAFVSCSSPGGLRGRFRIKPLEGGEVVEDNWYAVLQYGMRAGWAHAREMKYEEDGKETYLTITDLMRRSFKDGRVEDRLSSFAVVSGDNGPEHFYHSVSINGDLKEETLGYVKGDVMRITNASEAGENTVEIPKPACFSTDFEREFFSRDFKPGLKETRKVFDPYYRKELDITYEVIGKGKHPIYSKDVESWEVNQIRPTEFFQVSVVTVYFLSPDSKKTVLGTTQYGDGASILSWSMILTTREKAKKLPTKPDEIYKEEE